MTWRAVKLDEDLSAFVGEPLLRFGYDVATVVGQGWSGIKDEELWPKTLSENRMLITADKGFGDLRAYPPGTHPGIVVLRSDRESILDYQRLVARLVERHQLRDLAGSLTVVTARSIRIRRV